MLTQENIVLMKFLKVYLLLYFDMIKCYSSKIKAVGG